MFSLGKNDDALNDPILIILVCLAVSWSQLLVVLTDAHSIRERGKFGLCTRPALAETHGPSWAGRQGARLRNVLIIDVRAVS